VHVQTADALTSRARPRVLDELAVALVGHDLLAIGTADRVRASGSERQPVRMRDLRCSLAQHRDAVDRLVRRIGDLVRELDHRSVQLGLEDAGQGALLRACDELLDAGRQL
jgi:hypothetical protein